MTTITYNVLKITETEIYDPVNDNFEIVNTSVVAAELEFVIRGDFTQYSYERSGEFEEVSLFDPDGDPLDAYEFRVDGQSIAFEDSYSDLVRIEWGSSKESEVFVIGLDDFLEEIDPGEEIDYSFYIVELGGDPISAAVLADYEAWLDTFPTDEDGEPDSFDILSGPFRAGQQIGFSEADAFVSISDDDYVDAAFSPYTTFDLGKGNDTFIGSDAAERVSSGKGNDVIELGGGNDYVRVGGGREEFYGGAGKDYISYYDSSNGITANLATNEVSGSWAVNDIVVDFESIAGSRTGGDSITGTSGSNTIRTYGGNDRVAAGKGTDKVEMGSGNDYVRVGGGAESFDGGSGTDYISYYSSSNGIRIDLRDDEVSGSWAVNDTIKDFEGASGSNTGDDVMLGTNGANSLRGFGGDDMLYGRGGSDKLYGGSGEDFLDGGGGSGIDLLYGGSGADVFEFDRGEGVDVIKDFENNIDQINLDNFAFSTEDAYDFAEQVGSHVVFDFGADGMLTIENTTIGRLQNDLDVV